MKKLYLLAIVGVILPLSVYAQTLCTQIRDLKHCQGGEWKLVQSALDQGKMILRYRIFEQEELNLYVASGSVDLKGMVAAGAKVLEEGSERFAGLDWSILNTVATEKSEKSFATIFGTVFRGQMYYGYVSSSDREAAHNKVQAFLNGFNNDLGRSLTGPEFKGKKYYFGWGAAGSGDPSMMHNEVKYDVLHTHDIFTKEVGGSYIGVTYTDYKTATASNVRKTWNEIKGKATAEDMYVQYSSGHGYSSGLGIGVSYDEMRDNALGFGMKETIVFTMACQSGGLVDSFNRKKAEWEGFQGQGKTLFVMASSKTSENSSTGPGTDPEQPGGPNGSAGSAFGHALWKALIGHADGFKTGVKDGYLNLQEIRDFSVKKTLEVGGHTPVYTGSYDVKLIMNRVPSKAFLDSIGISSEGLSDEEVAERVRQLDQSLRVQ